MKKILCLFVANCFALEGGSHYNMEDLHTLNSVISKGITIDSRANEATIIEVKHIMGTGYTWQT